jgi:hypothetical protein
MPIACDTDTDCITVGDPKTGTADRTDHGVSVGGGSARAAAGNATGPSCYAGRAALPPGRPRRF